MAKKYLSLVEASELLGMPPEDLNRLRESGELRGFSDRGTWKFRSDDIESLRRTRSIDSDPDVPILDESVGDIDATQQFDMGKPPAPVGQSTEPIMSLDGGDDSLDLDLDDDLDSDDSILSGLSGMDAAASESSLVERAEIGLEDGGSITGSDSNVLDDDVDESDAGTVVGLGDDSRFNASDSDVRLIVDDSVSLAAGDSTLQTPADDDGGDTTIGGGTSDSDVKLMVDPDVGDNSDSDVRLIDSVGAAAALAGAGAAAGAAALAGDSDSDVKLVGDSTGDASDGDSVFDLDVASSDSDSDVRLVETPSDSEVRIDGLADSDSEVRLVEDPARPESDSDVQLVMDDPVSDEIDAGSTAMIDSPSSSEVQLGGSDSDVRLLVDDDSGIALEFDEADDASASVLLDDTSGVRLNSASDVLDSGESGISLAMPADSGVSLDLDDDEGIALPDVEADSGISLDLAEDSGLALDSGSAVPLAGDSGIALESIGDSGISLDAGSGLSLADSEVGDFGGTMPMMDAQTSGDEVAATAFDMEATGDDFDLADSMELDEGDATQELDAVDMETLEDSVADSAFDMDLEDDLSSDLSGDFEGELTDDFDDLEIESIDDGLMEGDDAFNSLDSSMGESGFAPVGARRAAVAPPAEWGIAEVATLALSSLVMLPLAAMMLDLMTTMWGYNAGTEPTTGPLLDLFSNK